MYACARVRVCPCARARIRACAHARMCACSCAHVRVRMCVCVIYVLDVPIFVRVVGLTVCASDVAKTPQKLLTTTCRSGDDTAKRVN